MSKLKERLLKPTELRPGMRTKSYEVLTEAVRSKFDIYSAKVRYRDGVEAWRSWADDTPQIGVIEEE